MQGGGRVGALGVADFDALRAAALWRALPPLEAQSMLAEAAAEALAPGETLFREREPSHYLYVVVAGWMKLTRARPDGGALVIDMASRGQTLAETAAFAGRPYPATAQAATAARVARFDAHALRARLAARPGLALALLDASAEALDDLMRRIEELRAGASPQRVARFLASLAPLREGAAQVALPYEKTLIAAGLGMQPESLSRAFAQLRAFGVRVKGGEALIDDLAALRAYASGGDRPAARRRPARPGALVPAQRSP
ncbi:MAG: Crp/Fnr family transcriptional regulator [Rhizobiales bacterium]|nr:Crp/Fnr family transcriptional regulator [Hyphomicrobiales bacterium]